MDKVYELEELKQVTGFLADLQLNLVSNQVIIDTLSYAVHLVNEIKEDPLYTAYIDQLDIYILQLTESRNPRSIAEKIIPVAVTSLRIYTKSVSKKLGIKKSFLARVGLWF